MIIAIDPGASGGIIAKLTTGKLIVTSMPETNRDIIDTFESFEETDGFTNATFKTAITVYMEQVGGFIGVGQPGSAMFKFGEGFGFLKGVIMAKGYRLKLVRPQEWQKALSLGTSKGVTKTQWKNKLKSRAQELYPEVKVTLKTADALLILEYALSKIKGD